MVGSEAALALFWRFLRRQGRHGIKLISEEKEDSECEVSKKEGQSMSVKRIMCGSKEAIVINFIDFDGDLNAKWVVNVIHNTNRQKRFDM